MELMDVCDDHVRVADARGIAGIAEHLAHETFRHFAVRIEKERERRVGVARTSQFKVVLPPFADNGFG